MAFLAIYSAVRSGMSNKAVAAAIYKGLISITSQYKASDVILEVMNHGYKCVSNQNKLLTLSIEST